MCLSRETEFAIKLNKKGEGWGWKCFRKRKGKLTGEFASINKPRPLSQWLKSEDFEPSYVEEGNMGAICFMYETGWHIFTTKEMATSWASQLTPVRVKFRQVITRGELGNWRGIDYHVIVAEEIFIPK